MIACGQHARGEATGDGKRARKKKNLSSKRAPPSWRGGGCEKSTDNGTASITIGRLIIHTGNKQDNPGGGGRMLGVRLKYKKV